MCEGGPRCTALRCSACCRRRCLASEFNAATYQQLLPLVSRAHTLLKTRHTNPEFWRSGLQLFRTCAQVALPPGPAEQIAGYVATAQEHLDAQEAQDSNERSAEDVAMSRDPDDILDSILSGNPLIAGALSTQVRHLAAFIRPKLSARPKHKRFEA